MRGRSLSGVQTCALPIRLSFPSNDAVRTDATLTLNTASTAARISTLLASGRTANATVFCSSFWRMLFSVMSGRIRIARAARVIVTATARPEDSEGGLPQVRPGSVPLSPSRPASARRSFRQRLLERLESGALAHHPPRHQELVDGDVRRRLDGQPRHVAGRARHVPVERPHDD